MSVDAPELSAEQLREQTLEWLHENLPAGWIEAIDAGDDDRVDDVAQRPRLRASGASASARPVTRRPRGRPSTAPGSRSPRARRSTSTTCSPTTRCRVRSTSSASAWVARRSSRGGPRSRSTGCCAPSRDERGDLVPALQRAGRGLRRRRAVDPRGARRRRVGRQRPEGVDDARAPLALGDAAGAHEPRRARSTAASRTSSSTCTRRASRSGRSCRSPATPSSTRCSSTTRASPTGCVGPEGDGWKVAITTLMNERVALSGAGSSAATRSAAARIDRLIARHRPVARPAGCASGSRRRTSRAS